MMEFQVVDPQIDIVPKKTKKKPDSMAKGFFKRLTGVMTTKNKNAPNLNSFENFSETSSKRSKRDDRELKVIKRKRKSSRSKAAYAAAGAGGMNLSGSYWLSKSDYKA